MLYFIFCPPLNPLKGTWLIDKLLRCSPPKPLLGFGVKKYDNKLFLLLSFPFREKLINFYLAGLPTTFIPIFMPLKIQKGIKL